MSLGFFLLAFGIFVTAFVFMRWHSNRLSSPGSRQSPPVKNQKTQRTPIQSISPQNELALRQLIKKGATIQAIKQVRRLTNLGLKDAKDYVNSLDEDQRAPSLDSQVPPELKAKLKNLTQKNQKIQAIKQLRAYTGWGLKESNDYINRL
jgi:ribosomal protein L7/L12